MAAKYPLKTYSQSLYASKFLNCLVGIFGTCGLESAYCISKKKGSEKHVVKKGSFLVETYKRKNHWFRFVARVFYHKEVLMFDAKILVLFCRFFPLNRYFFYFRKKGAFMTKRDELFDVLLVTL